MDQKLYSRTFVKNNVPTENVVSAVEKAFVEKYNERVQMPAKSYLDFPEHNGDLRTMPAYVPTFDLATVKVVNAHPDNPSEHSLPTVMALIVAVNPENGSPLAVLDGTEITALRTAAASALSSRLFAPADGSTLGIIGAGGQARHQIDGQLLEVDFDEIMIYDTARKKAKTLRDWIEKAYPSLRVEVATTPGELFEACDVINSLTPATSPLIEPLPERSAPLLINAMGADAHRKREWPDELLASSEIVIDDWEQASHSGEISQLVEEGTIRSKDIWGSLGQFLQDPPEPLPERVLFDSTGLAIQDTAAAAAVLSADQQPDETFDFLNLKSSGD